MAQNVIPRDARLISLLLASTPGIEDAEPAILNQLLEFSHREHGFFPECLDYEF